MAHITLTEFDHRLTQAADEFRTRARRQLLLDLGNSLRNEIIQLTPVDEGTLRASIEVRIIDNNTVEVGTNLEYAKYVNNGHVQHKRFLPARYLLQTVKGRRYLKSGNLRGIMLSERFIPGAHMFERGMINFEQMRLESILSRAMINVRVTLEGGRG